MTSDRSSGGVLCVLLMLTLVLQVVWATAAMAAMAAPTAMICTSAADGSHEPTAPSRHPECACGLLCQAGIAAPAIVAPSDPTVLPVRFAERIEHLAERIAPSAAPRAEGLRQARAPPSIILRS